MKNLKSKVVIRNFIARSPIMKKSSFHKDIKFLKKTDQLKKHKKDLKNETES